MWNIAELETIVELFKRSLDQQSVTSKFKIQSVDLFVTKILTRMKMTKFTAEE